MLFFILRILNIKISCLLENKTKVSQKSIYVENISKKNLRVFTTVDPVHICWIKSWKKCISTTKLHQRA